MGVLISPKPFMPSAELKAFTSKLPDVGAITSFTGVVRAEAGVESLILSHYPGFTEQHIQAAGDKACQTWGLAGWHVRHRVGPMSPGDAIVFVGCAAAHRRAAFEACDYLMDILKTETPFWKQEKRGGETDWIEPRAEDKADRNRWEI